MADELNVTMFNVGFGDCFLVDIPVGSRPFRMLFDCGRHKGGTKENQELADEVIEAAKDADGTARIDVIVATHRHKDHVSGFAADGWDKVQVREVWLPWTENPEDPNARGLAARQVKAAALAQAAATTNPALGANRHSLGLLELALSNEAAMDTLYHGFAGAPVRRYLPDETDPLEPLTLSGVPGVRLHVMGPTRDETTLGTMDPPKAETFRKLAAAGGAGGGTGFVPFPAQWVRNDTILLPPEKPALDGDDEQELARLSAQSSLTALSAAIDNAINNTSLVVMIEVGTARLLFCADAQWGNWRAILAEPHWCELIKTTTFLKVGHHASHNASPVTLINALLPKGIPAMVSVETKIHNGVPNDELLKAFGTQHYSVARSDEPAPAGYTAGDGRISLAMDF